MAALRLSAGRPISGWRRPTTPHSDARPPSPRRCRQPPSPEAPSLPPRRRPGGRRGAYAQGWRCGRAVSRCGGRAGGTPTPPRRRVPPHWGRQAGHPPPAGTPPSHTPGWLPPGGGWGWAGVLLCAPVSCTVGHTVRDRVSNTPLWRRAATPSRGPPTPPTILNTLQNLRVCAWGVGARPACATQLITV